MFISDKFIKTIASGLLLLFLNFISSHEAKLHEVEECREVKEKLKPVPISQPGPTYPTGALTQSVEANVLIEFTVNEKGKVEDPKTIWIDHTSDKKNDLFSRSALKSMNAHEYAPGRNEQGEAISVKGERVLIKYRIQGLEDNLMLNNTVLEKIILRTNVKDLSPKSITRLEKALEQIDKQLQNKKLSGIERAAYLYIKGMTLFKLNAPNELIKKSLLESKSYYQNDYIDTIRGGVQVRGVSSSKLHTFGGLLLTQIYFVEEDWNNLEHEMLEVINSMTKGETLKERFYSSYIQLGIASYTLENWCTSVASFERARRISEIHNFTFPNNFDSAIEYAKSQMELVK
mgnify:CR=1 FL=1|tara:strand:+ start:482 stop:1516 length:1035 start_codon:yes stop_codon:yes gene_type:complete